MKIGLVGMPGSGKSTVFRALTGLPGETGAQAARGRLNLGVVKVPDPRVERLAELYQPKKTTFAEMTFSDLAPPAAATRSGSERSGIDAPTLQVMRELDALCQVVRAFSNPALPEPPDALRELRDFAAERLLADLDQVEKRIERLKKEGGKAQELTLLERLRQHLDAERPLRTMDLRETEWAAFSGYRFLTQKPLLLVLNVAEPDVARPTPGEAATYAHGNGLGLVVLSGQVEMEIAQLEPNEQREFARSLGLDQPARDRFIRAAYALLDLISFLTVGPDDCRAWTIRRGTRAQRAAGKIHGDIERGFIRAEVIRFEDLSELGTEARCREAGKLRIEGKDYLIADGDVINFRFNV
jgi:GTP-binding protein YchF